MAAARSYTAILIAISLLLLVTFSSIVKQGALIVALQPHTRSHACFSARSVVPNASVFLLVPMATSKSALATTAGRQRKEDPNALKEKFR
ncbi:hypothetical protein RJT34_11541 [Clitoria ternatea]|uniref:Uncharacterized protein n=1 Tax=Clitoria ternatea TaxID=43366 RepID=A0AAN9PJR6_CLITE